MSQVAIEKVDGKRAAASSIVDEVKTLSERIRRRAFEIFERRGGVEGSAMDGSASSIKRRCSAALICRNQST